MKYKKSLGELLDKRDELVEDLECMVFDLDECESEDENLPHDIDACRAKLKKLQKKIKKAMKGEWENL